MSLHKKILEDMKAAMKARDKERLEAIRGIKSAIMLAQTEKGGMQHELADEDIIKIIQKLHKQRMESATVYKEQNRDDLADKELIEAKVMDDYLPAQLSDTELEKVLKGIIDETGASSMADMGKVMGVASRQLAGKADGKRISGFVKKLLSK